MPVELKIPSVGESVTEVYIGEWRKSSGDRVEKDEEVVEIESEKATFDIPAPAEGVLSKIIKQSGETAQVGEVIAVIEDEQTAEESSKKSGKKQQAKADADQDRQKPAESEKSQAKDDADEQQQAAPTDEDDADEQQHAATADDDEDEKDADVEVQPRIMPAARRALQKHGLRSEDVEATGPGGRLLKEDVLRRAAEQDGEQPESQAGPAPRGSADRREEAVPMSPIRRRIAQRLVDAQKSAALLTTFNEVDLSAVKALRKRHQDEFVKTYDVKLGFMSFFVKAAVDALRQTPKLNAEIREDHIVYKNYFDIGVAVSTDKGLMVPVIRNAERLSFAEIERAIDDFARRARDGKLNIDELSGGTFTITNGGIFGSLLSTPIVNPPQSGVLGMHAIQDRPVVRDGEIVVRPMMYLALTYDHRVVDGREAVTFLKRIAEAIEDPARMLIEV
ncbi:MAG: 2-oxoglutarate dehydrogenase complex dihydrolipoyllysine-residue succinyltransferase [Planctomycetota bacterium]|nr:MAG: 2-oxoglutarate dehydrogenase complex dihydrolipoyllysine-residue succinyltransferase [Planctomycetota bacterium]REJ94965.1 MAG: 2-oxoglutarate dehydrogenase complex dihydrolipoyllysine-residue succinyltransferase [Planctomycetota bacterium]REK20009.1 MAG: 2-oxoglutarate dehydrogenase complex dihydrolipoyllysine-residue succinyltransferase [Planctomycetota bacterium]REK27576.1 MAG: 2-oxoglutarate dehydrogenase complex dihydrolipoyllysine-residue succinyltransferase [Planctomycetota bacter